MTVSPPIAASSIVAQAFRFMELAPVSSFEDDTEQAAAAKEQFPIAMRHCLELCDWSFASVFQYLSASAPDALTAIDPKLPYCYRLPDDVIALREVGDGVAKWRLDRTYLRSALPAPLAIRYTGLVSNERILPAGFQTAVSFRLAFLLAPRWLQTASKISDLESRAEFTINEAMRSDSRNASASRYDDLPDQGDWMSEALR